MEYSVVTISPDLPELQKLLTAHARNRWVFKQLIVLQDGFWTLIFERVRLEPLS